MGEKDNMPRIMADLGEMFIRFGVKPGKPTIMVKLKEKRYLACRESSGGFLYF